MFRVYYLIVLSLALQSLSVRPLSAVPVTVLVLNKADATKRVKPLRRSKNCHIHRPKTETVSQPAVSRVLFL